MWLRSWGSEKHGGKEGEKHKKDSCEYTYLLWCAVYGGKGGRRERKTNAKRAGVYI